MAPDDFSLAIERLARKAPTEWLASVCGILKSLPASVLFEDVVELIPAIHNADLSSQMAELIYLAHVRMTWEALGWVMSTTASAYYRWQLEHQIELLWAGPFPANRIPARRIDQTLYDLIANAKHEILLVTFAAAKIERLSNKLLQAARRGISIRLILEFEQSSEGQLSYDALKAFPPALTASAHIFCWPIKNRKRNPAGRPGKLHAKLAVVDDNIIVSSANLTDDAFNRNLEIGVRVLSNELLMSINEYLDSLVRGGELIRVQQFPVSFKINDLASWY